MAGFDPSVETLLARWAWRVFDDVSLEPGKPWQYAVLTVDDSGEKSVAARSETVRMENVPLPPMPLGVQAAPGRGHVALRWEEVPGHVRGYAVFVADATGVKRVSGEEFVKGTEFVVWLDGGGSRRFSVRAADRAKRLGPPSNEVEAAPLPPPHDPVFFTALQGERAATGQEGRLAGRARLGADGLDTRDGGWIAYPPEELLQPGAPLTIELWVDIDRIEGIPVLISYGHWEGPGWWLQLIGGKIQFYLPVQKILDAGTLPTGGWHHLAATYDGGISRLFVDGKEAGSLDVGPVNPAPWGGELRIGTYSEDALAFQTFGRIGPVGIWRRALPAQEIRARFAIGR